jgi:hypothetical protein
MYICVCCDWKNKTYSTFYKIRNFDTKDELFDYYDNCKFEEDGDFIVVIGTNIILGDILVYKHIKPLDENDILIIDRMLLKHKIKNI